MGKSNYVFERKEVKYLLAESKWIELMDRFSTYIVEDQYGLHTVCNIYYDTDNYDLIRTSIDKPRYKEKLRLRSYGIPEEISKVFIEIKKKYNGTVYKRRVALSLKEAERFLESRVIPESEFDQQILQEISYFVKLYQPKPVIYLAYDRRAYFGKEDSEIRITIDQNIRSREDGLHLSDGDKGRVLLENGMRLMEIKVPLAMPLWLVNSLNGLEIYPVSFSKYGSVYQKNLAESIQRKENEILLEELGFEEEMVCLQVS